ncbi:MAG: hypothetical protein IJU65_11070 [Desulfovibrio sp.]|nr:hypothetical protein [Desulfovibrio sp.]
MKLQRKIQSVPGIAELPRPDPARAGVYKITILAIVAVLLVSTTAFWLTRDNDTRLRWREEAASVIDNATDGTMLAGAGDYLREAPPPPPPSVTNPMTLPGTLAGQTVQGSLGGMPTGDVTTQTNSGSSVSRQDTGAQGPTDQGMLGQNLGGHNTAGQTMVGQGIAGQAVTGQGMAGRGTAEQTMAGLSNAPQYGTPQVMPKVTEDSRVRPSVVEDLAAWLVSRYKRGPHGGSLNVSVQSLNQRYGVKLAAAASQGRGGGRDALLRYAFQPTMLRGLYGLYADRFLAAVNREAAARGFTEEQTGQLRSALSGRLALLAKALEGVASVGDLSGRLSAVDKAAQNAVDINAQMAEAVFALDQLRENKASAGQLSTASLRVEGLTARYRRALDSQTVAERSLVAAVRQKGGLSLDDDTLLFLAQWVGRRLKNDAQALASVQASASVLRDLARRSIQQDTAGQQTASSLTNAGRSVQAPSSSQATSVQPPIPQPSGSLPQASVPPVVSQSPPAVAGSFVPESVPALPAQPLQRPVDGAVR